MAERESGAEAQKFDPAASAGLFVGVSRFEDPAIKKGVPFAVDDAVDLAYLFAIELRLLAPENAVLLLTGQPKKEKSQKHLKDLEAQGARLGRPRLHEIFRDLSRLTRSTRFQGLFILAAATHGLARDGNSYFVAEDTLLERAFPMSVPIPEIFEKASDVASKRALVLIDACRERLKVGTRSLGGQGLSEDLAKALAAAEGVAVLSGTIHGGFSFDDPVRENGVFTAAVLDGLRGEAPAGDEGWITAQSLAPFVEKRVVSWIQANAREYAGTSRGIGLNLDNVKSFPLAPHAQSTKELQAFRARRATALEHLKKFQGAVLKGTHWDLADELLPQGKPDAESEVLLELIEAMTEARSTQQSLRGYLVDVRVEKAPTILTPYVEVVSPPPPSRVVTPREPKVGDIHEGPFGLRFCWVPSGTYTLGSPKDEPGRASWEQEPHDVVLPAGFWLGETAVTQRQWNELIPEKPFHFKHCGPECPAESINWFEALTFANLLSERESLPPCYELLGRKGKLGEDLTYEKVAFLGGEGYRLPSEDEWEIAARAGSEWALYTGGITIKGENKAPELDAIAWYGGNSGVTYQGGFDSSEWKEMQTAAKLSGPHPVRGKAANAWGLFDMLGNVFEWCDEGIDPDYTRNPESWSRVICGGSWDSIARFVRSAYRSGSGPSLRWKILGFRLARGQGLRSSQGARSAQK